MTKKPCLVLLPGLLNDEASWQAQIDRFSAEHDIVVPDLTKFETMGELAQSVLQQAPDTFILAGLSMGGYVALEIMRQQPDRVQKLILMNTGSRADTPEQTKTRYNFIRMAGQERFRGVTHRLLLSLIAPEHIGDEKMAETIFAMAERVGRDGFIRQQMAIIRRIDSRPSLRRITCPVMAISGDHDQLTPPQLQQEIASLIPGARHEILASCGHLSALEQPEKLNELIGNFID